MLSSALLQIGERRQKQQLKALAGDTDAAVLDRRAGQDVLVQVVKVVVQPQQEVGQSVEVVLGAVGKRCVSLRRVGGKHVLDRPQHRHLGGMAAAGQHRAQPAHIG